jgi:hypothetical protein
MRSSAPPLTRRSSFRYHNIVFSKAYGVTRGTLWSQRPFSRRPNQGIFAGEDAMGENRQGGNDRNDPSGMSQDPNERQDQQRQGSVDRQQNKQGGQQQNPGQPERRDQGEQADQGDIERDRQR